MHTSVCVKLHLDIPRTIVDCSSRSWDVSSSAVRQPVCFPLLWRKDVLDRRSYHSRSSRGHFGTSLGVGQHYQNILFRNWWKIRHGRKSHRPACIGSETAQSDGKGKLSQCLTKHHAMKTYWVVEVESHAFLTSILGGEWLASRPGRFTPDGKLYLPFFHFRT
jgi:hypothetical protein